MQFQGEVGVFWRAVIHHSTGFIAQAVPSVFAIQDGLRRGSRIPAADQDLSLEVYFSGWEDHQNGQKCGDEALEQISGSRDV